MKKAYLIGSGIASMSAAVFMIRDGKMPGSNITIFEYTDLCGGSLDAAGTSQEGYVCRGTRGFDYKAFVCMQEMFESIPAADGSGRSLNRQIHDFSDGFSINSKTRLMKDHRPFSAKDYGVSKKDLFIMTRLVAKPERFIKDSPVNEVFTPQFFQTPFWWMFSTIFAFGPWHSTREVRRYMRAFFQNVPDLHTMNSIRACPLNNEENIVQPMVKYLKGAGVKFEMETEVSDVRFNGLGEKKVAEVLICKKNNKVFEIEVEKEDCVLLTLGSIAAPVESPAWQLWHTISKNGPEFGNPSHFTSQPENTTMTTCTITLNDLEVWLKLEEIYGITPDTNRLTTFMDSPWSMSLVVPKQPWFGNQPEDTRVLWCYGIWPKGIGKYVPKRMEDCTPSEILTELFSLIGLSEVDRLVNKTIAKKTVLPTGHAQFVVRKPGDRPKVVPKNAANFGFLGQYVESEGTTYTMEYSVRTAQKAVYELLRINKKLPSIYKGVYVPRDQVRAAKTFLR